MTMKNPKYIILDGIEGCGKSTQLSRLKAYYALENITNVVYTREPGGTDVGLAIRKILLSEWESPPCPETEIRLFDADRVQHVTTVVGPALRAGKHVVQDRGPLSTLAYQGYGRERPHLLRPIEEMNDRALAGNMPDLYIIFDCPADVGLARKKRQGEITRFEREEIKFHERVREGFLRRKDLYRSVIIDAMPSADDVWKIFRAVIERELSSA